MNSFKIESIYHDYLEHEQLENRKKYKKYQKAYRNWIYEGDFNSNSIPTINKYFSVTDMPTSKIKN